MRKEILITGGAGFVGFEAAKHFLRRGNYVTVLDNRRESPRWGWMPEEFSKILGSVETIESYLPENNFDVIIHCAGQTAVTHSLTNPERDFITNAEGTFKVLEFARKGDSEVIFTSTNKVYGSNVNHLPVHLKMNPFDKRLGRYECNYPVGETFGVDMTHHSPYGASKLAADLYVQEYRHTYGLKTNVFRMSCIYGDSQTGTEDQGWVHHIANLVFNNQPVKIFGDGFQVRDILYVTDLIELMDKVIEKKSSGVMNVGGGVENTISVIELIDMVRSGYGNISYHPWREADQKVYISDTRVARNIYNWKPKVGVEEGVRKLLNAFALKQSGEDKKWKYLMQN